MSSFSKKCRQSCQPEADKGGNHRNHHVSCTAQNAVVHKGDCQQEIKRQHPVQIGDTCIDNLCVLAEHSHHKGTGRVQQDADDNAATNRHNQRCL